MKQALELSPQEKLELIEAVWDSLSDEQIPLSPSEKALLDKRLAEEGDGLSWDEVTRAYKPR